MFKAHSLIWALWNHEFVPPKKSLAGFIESFLGEVDHTNQPETTKDAVYHPKLPMHSGWGKKM